MTNPETGFSLTEVVGDLFSCPDTTSLCHCVSEDLAMGKGSHHKSCLSKSLGIAVLFKKKFGGIDELKKQQQRPGGVAFLRRENRFVFYLITKLRYFNKPTYTDLKDSLVSMKDLMMEHNVKDLAMPRIGSSSH